jgi:hypothetical protein
MGEGYRDTPAKILLIFYPEHGKYKSMGNKHSKISRYYIVWPLIIVLSLYVFICFHQELPNINTADEKVDSRIVTCYADTLDPLECQEDITQARLPYYIHALAKVYLRSIFGRSIHHVVSMAFGAATIVLIYLFALKETNEKTAILSICLLATSMQFLSSSRMALSQSNIIFTALTTATAIAFYYFIKTDNTKTLILSAILYGLTVASNLLGVLIPLLLIIFYIISGKRTPKATYLIFLPVAVIIFFLASPVYLKSENIEETITLITTTPTPEEWNYLGTYNVRTPWFFSYVLFTVKMTPWWTILFIYTIAYMNKKTDLCGKFSKSILIYVLVILFIKSAKYGYDNPHHQVNIYPLVCFTIAYNIELIYSALKSKWWETAFSTIIALMFTLQLSQIYLFYPYMHFYGSQYGKQFVGSIYGPAVLTVPDIRSDNALIKRMTNDQKILDIFQFCRDMRVKKKFRAFKEGEYKSSRKYAIIDYLWGDHWEYEPMCRQLYREYIRTNCEKIYSNRFPVNFEIKALYRCDIQGEVKKAQTW